MKVEVVKCSCCGGPIGALDHEGMVECNYCNSNLLVKLNNNPNDPKHKLVVEQVKPKEEKKVETEAKPKDRVIVLKDDEEKTIKDKHVKQRIISLAAAVAVAAGIGTIGVSTYKHIRGNLEKSDTKPKYGVTDYAVKIPSSKGFHDAPWDDGKTVIGHVANYYDLTPEEIEEAQRQVQEVTSELIKGNISNEEALERFESAGITVDSNFFEEIEPLKDKEYVLPKQEENTSTKKDLDSLDVIFMDEKGDTKIVHMNKDDVIACDDFGSRVMFLHPNPDGTYKDLISDSYVELNEQYWNKLHINEISKYNSIIYPMKDGTSIVYSDEVIQVIKNKSEVDTKGKSM